MKLTRQSLRKMIMEEISRSNSLFLLEAEDEKKDDVGSEGDSDEGDPADNLFPSDEEEGSNTGDADTEEEPKEDTDSDDESDKNMIPADEAKEDAEEARIEGAKDAMELERTISEPLSRAVNDALNDAVGSVKKVVDAVSDVNEALVKIASGRGGGMLSRLIFESDQDLEIDLPLYAQRIANLITNYNNILDIEKAIFDAAYKLLKDNEEFGPDIADEFRDILARDYDLEFDHIYDPEKADQTIYAVGSRKPEST